MDEFGGCSKTVSMRCCSMFALVFLVVAEAVARIGVDGIFVSFFIDVGVVIFCSPCCF